jgi:CRISPR-associated exonuclease Cas4
MSYTEDDLIPLSALQHFVFCERQCALIHVEQAWSENRLTAEGRLLHERVHEQDGESRAGVRIERGLPLRSLRLGLVGIADVVEFQPLSEGVWRPFPVEYKRGKPKPDRSDEVQLCAQAMCLEEMLEVMVPAGAMFYGKIRRRHDVIFDKDIREETERIAGKVHALLSECRTPKPVFQKRCGQCSLISLCLPKAVQKRRSIERYLSGAITE